ncbi:hypothetical protein LSH36_74g09021 [Paralvinella palmiformis]|uniref:Domain of unknown function with conserved HDNR motif domain-containing protein n=1 Tax=Paralvinella palmiformis TaxID=53620 RepID=A0AAD9K3P6_9ANNE|nr:hypothetical protein LSH36_74g09021 [Paralvinella palmiformis]
MDRRRKHVSGKTTDGIWGNYKKSNSFSVYDNRHSFQDHGVYFGDSIVSSDNRQHWTDSDFLKHYGKTVTDYDYNTQYKIQYNTQYGAQHTQDSPNKHRFPKIYKEPDANQQKLDTTTTNWFTSPDVPHQTPLQVLATSQEPFPAANAWKYSYHSLAKCYPSYETNTKRYQSWLTTEKPSNMRKHVGNII